MDLTKLVQNKGKEWLKASQYSGVTRERAHGFSGFQPNQTTGKRNKLSKISGYKKR